MKLFFSELYICTADIIWELSIGGNREVEVIYFSLIIKTIPNFLDITTIYTHELIWIIKFAIVDWNQGKLRTDLLFFESINFIIGSDEFEACYVALWHMCLDSPQAVLQYAYSMCITITCRVIAILLHYNEQ